MRMDRSKESNTDTEQCILAIRHGRETSRIGGSRTGGFRGTERSPHLQ